MMMQVARNLYTTFALTKSWSEQDISVRVAAQLCKQKTMQAAILKAGLKGMMHKLLSLRSE